MNKFLVRLAQLEFILLGAFLIIFTFDFGNSNGHFFVPGSCLFGMGVALGMILHLDKSWSKKIITERQFVVWCISAVMVLIGCLDLLASVWDIMNRDMGLGWLQSASKIWFGLFVARVGISLR